MGAFIGMRRRFGWGAIALLGTLAACSPEPPNAVSALNKPPGIANLLKERLRGDLLQGRSAESPSTYPARVRILPYDHQTALQPVDQLAHLDGLADALRKHPDLVREASVLPEAYGESIGASFDGLMKLHGNLRADVFLLVSGRASFLEASERSVGFFDWLGSKSYWEAHSSLEALWIEAPSGRYLPSLQAAAKGGPEVVAPQDSSTSGSAYGLRRQVEGAAFRRLADALVTQLKAELAARPSPKPSATPSPLPDAQATGEVDAAGEARQEPAASGEG